jgi:hypothetical protein
MRHQSQVQRRVDFISPPPPPLLPPKLNKGTTGLEGGWECHHPKPHEVAAVGCVWPDRSSQNHAQSGLSREPIAQDKRVRKRVPPVAGRATKCGATRDVRRGRGGGKSKKNRHRAKPLRAREYHTSSERIRGTVSHSLDAEKIPPENVTDRTRQKRHSDQSPANRPATPPIYATARDKPTGQCSDNSCTACCQMRNCACVT